MDLDAAIGSSSGERSPLGPGIDVRGPGRRSGGYVVGPGYVVDGQPYYVEINAPIEPLPAWIRDRLQGTLIQGA
ncbi:bifunctional DNA primase/polymerase [Streptomyces sp. NPDC048717]|uniref:bifunctional DNA primase/polymerase n=1 Tax=Streptomyces sp. NPDC048717 TaxID=3154928 RepID=UPI003412F5FF